MKGLDGMIRLHRWRLDEERRTLAGLEDLAADLHGRLDILAGELAAENGAAAATPEAAGTLAAYHEAVRARRARLALSLAEVEAQIETVRAAVSEAFAELKRFEQGAENRRSRSRAAADRRARLAMDELGLELFRRRKLAVG